MANNSLHYILHSGKRPNWIFYFKSALREVVPDAVMRRRLEQVLERGKEMYDEEYVMWRVDYYCKLLVDGDNELRGAPQPIGALRRRGNGSAYYFDAHSITRFFDPQLSWQYLFGDLRQVPDSPTVVKSRPVGDDNANGVLLKLNSNRHYIFVDDRRDIADKDDRAIFRGLVGPRPNRQLFVEKWGGHPRVDVANTLAKGGIGSHNADGKLVEARLSIYDHLTFRYIMSLEGNDVASNLKWVMSSNSLAVTPRPLVETWFMEGRLRGDEHYMEVRADFADLIERMDYYSAHLDEARRITDNAHRWVDQFRDGRRERYIGLRVMQKYLDFCNRGRVV